MKPKWLEQPAKPVSQSQYDAALIRQNQLTKPQGSLGELENIAVRLASLQNTQKPLLDHINIVIFAGDHGIATQGVSLYPQAVTVEMIRNFSRGGAAISVLARHLGATLEVIDTGCIIDPGSLDGVLSQRISFGTASFHQAPAMTPAQLSEAMTIGFSAAARAAESKTELFIGGEMGIGNTTSATAIACALLKESVEKLVGPGTGLDHDGIKQKTEIIKKSLIKHNDAGDNPWQVLQRFGGFEIAALTGSYIAAAQQGMAILVDGFICSIAALAAIRINPDIKPWLFFAHASSEPGHAIVMKALNAKPLLDFGMRLGEGSGAAVAVPLLRSAVALHNEMATFSEANVSEANNG